MDKYCFNCGSELNKQDGFKSSCRSWVCKNCGCLIEDEIEDYGKSYEPNVQVNDKPPIKTSNNSWLEIFSLAFGLVGLFTCIFPASIVAIVLACISLNRDENKGAMAIIGLVTGIVEICIWILYIAYFKMRF